MLVFVNQVFLMTQSNSHLVPGKDDMKILRLNVKGLYQVIKRKRVFSDLQYLGSGIAFLQETHLQN